MFWCKWRKPGLPSSLETLTLLNRVDLRFECSSFDVANLPSSESGSERSRTDGPSPRSQWKVFECYNDSAHYLFLNKNSALNKNTSMEFCSFRPSVLSSFYWIELAESKITDGKDKQIFSHALTLTNTRREHNCLNSLSLGSKTKTEVFTWNSKAEQPGSGRLSARSLFSVNQCGGQWSSTNLHQFGSPSSILD